MRGIWETGKNRAEVVIRQGYKPERNSKMREKILEVLKAENEEIVEDLDRDLLASGILDSFDIVNLVVALEEALGISIDVELVSPENFQTAESIIRMIEGIG